MNRHVILGAGVAGRRAAEIIREREAEDEIVLVDRAPDPFYYKPMLGEWVAGSLARERIATRRRLAEKDVRLETGVMGAEVDPAAGMVALEGGERLAFDRLLIATGRKTRRAPWDDGDCREVVYLDGLSDAEGLAALLESARRGVVWGMGFSALSAVRALRARGVACTVVFGGERFWQRVLDPTSSRILEDRLRQEGAELVAGVEVEEIVRAGGRLEAVRTSQGEDLPADLLVVAGPQVPATDFLQGAEWAGPAGVIVDGTLRTRYENVFAAGDVAALPGMGGGEPAPRPGWLSSWQQGNIAGMNMLGGSARFEGIPAVRTKVFDVDVVCLGLSDLKGEGVREETGDYPYEELPYIYKKILFKDDRVVGALFLGDVSEAAVVERWIREGRRAADCDQKVLDQMFQVRLPSGEVSGALCPVCKFQIQVAEDAAEGTVVTCPACGVEFRLQRMQNGVFRAELAG